MYRRYSRHPLFLPVLVSLGCLVLGQGCADVSAPETKNDAAEAAARANLVTQKDDASTDSSSSASAVPLTTGPGSAILVIDNGGAGFNLVSGAAWTTVTTPAGFFGTNFAQRVTNASLAQVEWRPTITLAGTYEVAVWYNCSSTPSTSRAVDAHYAVDHALGTTTLSVNQQINGSRWLVLGTFQFNAGTTGRVTLTSQGSSPSSTRFIVADAVRFRTLPQTFEESGATVLGGYALDGRSGSFADIDNDGDLDLFIQGSGFSPRALLRNNKIGLGTPNFTDISSTLHITSTSSWSAWGDYDGDGDVDVFVGQSNNDPVTGMLMRNDGAAGFVDASVTTGLNDPGFAQNVAWCDIDNDGDLDLIIAMEGPEKHEIYLQGPPGHFTAVGAAVGFQVAVGTKAYGMAIGDTDGDGDNDIYISTCRADDNIRKNFFKNMLVETGSLAFVDIADTNGTQTFKNGYHAEFYDFDDDGDLDLLMVGSDGEPSKLWRNDGNNAFTDIDSVTGHPLISDTGGDLNGGKVLDYDNDGRLDLFMHDHLVQNGKNHARLLYHNDGNWTFTNVTLQEGLDEACITNSNAGYDGSWADFDMDGDLDLFDTAGALPASGGINQPQRLFVSNVSTNGNHWLFVRLKGTPANTTAIGAQLYATIDMNTPQQKTLRRDANANAGTFNQSDVPVHFGLGPATVVDQLRIVWPNHVQQTYLNVPVNHYITMSIYSIEDFDRDLDVDGDDLNHFSACALRSGVSLAPGGCANADLDGDGDADMDDFGVFQRCYTGAGHPQTDPSCLIPPVVQ